MKTDVEKKQIALAKKSLSKRKIVPNMCAYVINQGNPAAGLTYHKNQNQMSYVPSNINPFFHSSAQ